MVMHIDFSHSVDLINVQPQRDLEESNHLFMNFLLIPEAEPVEK